MEGGKEQMEGRIERKEAGNPKKLANASVSSEQWH